LKFLRLIALLFPGTVLPAAHAGSAGEIHWFFIFMSLIGGLALFLYGIGKMSDGLKKVAGAGMRNILSTFTRNRLNALAIGAFVTTIMQSSSATTVMLVSFVQAELMGFASSIGVILGANIGATVTAQLIAFKLTDYALAMIAIGFFITIISRDKRQRSIGESILGFGLLFFGMKLMSDAMEPLRSFQPFLDLLGRLENPFLGLLAGATFTALIQSSGALTGIAIVLAQQGVLTLEAGIPLILGANIGTCVTAGLASLGASREAKRVAMAHVAFNISGALIFIFVVPQLADFIRSISPKSALSGAAALAAETPRQIANAHTVFNVTVALVFLPLTHALAALILKLYPERPIEQGIAPTTKYINDVALKTPALALDLARNEVARMSRLLSKMLKSVIRPFFDPQATRDERKPELTLLEGLEMRDGKVDYLERRLSDFLLRLSRSELTEAQASETFTLVSIVDHLESIGDIIMRNMVPLIDKKREESTEFTPEGREELRAYHEKVMKQLSRLNEIFQEQNTSSALTIMRKREKYDDLEAQFRKAHLSRLFDEQELTLRTHEIHLELLDSLRLINTYVGDIAKYMAELNVTGKEAA